MWGKIDNFFIQAFQLINLKNKTKKQEKQKSIIGTHNNNCYRKFSLMDARISGQKLKQEQGMLQSFKVSPSNIFSNYRQRNLALCGRHQVFKGGMTSNTYVLTPCAPSPGAPRKTYHRCSILPNNVESDSHQEKILGKLKFKSLLEHN